jgi:hypothetical protein
MSRFIPARNVFTKNAAILSNHYLTHQLEGDRRSPYAIPYGDQVSHRTVCRTIRFYSRNYHRFHVD